jgi:hypothetical protein
MPANHLLTFKNAFCNPGDNSTQAYALPKVNNNAHDPAKILRNVIE